MARQNDHNRAEELISAYLDKRVSAEEQEFFERHIASCADCRAELEATRSMVAALQAMPAMKAPRSFVLPREMAKQPKRSFLSLVSRSATGDRRRGDGLCCSVRGRFADQPIGWWQCAAIHPGGCSGSRRDASASRTHSGI